MAWRDALKDGRVVAIDGQITGTMQEQRRDLRELFLNDPTRSIRLLIASEGGSVTGTLAMLDEIAILTADGARIDGLIAGYAYSGAAFILQACRKRIAGPSAILMLHGGTGETKGDDEDIDAARALRARYHQRFADVVGFRTQSAGGLTPTQWRRKFRSNVGLYYTADEALRAGLVDEVIG